MAGALPRKMSADDGEHVSYQTPAGEMSLPKSIVERIDRDGFIYSTGARGVFDLPVSAPRVDPVVGYEDIAQHAVHNNAIDFAYIASLETDARSGAAIPCRKEWLPRITPPRNFS